MSTDNNQQHGSIQPTSVMEPEEMVAIEEAERLAEDAFYDAQAEHLAKNPPAAYAESDGI